MSVRHLEFDPPASLDLVVRGSFFAQRRISYPSDKILPSGMVPALFDFGNPHRLGKSPNMRENTALRRFLNVPV